MGVAEGRSWPWLREQINETDSRDPVRAQAEGAETWAELYRRVGDGFDRLLQDHSGQTIVVVGHGGTVGAGNVHMGGIPHEDGVDILRGVTNTSLTEWHHSGGRWHLVRFNDAEHLTHLR